MNNYSDLFPPIPDYQARFRAVYLEPIAGSGERFAVGVMVQSRAGEAKVLQTLSPKTLRCMYADKAVNIMSFITLALESANDHLTAGGDIGSWIPPISGVYLGPLEQTYSSSGMEGVLFQAITLHASLYRGDLVDNALAEINDEEIQDDTEADAKTENLIKSVRSICLESGWPDNYWQREVLVKDRGRLCVDYLGPHYHANLSNFDVRYIKPAYGSAKAKLFDLDVLRNKRQQEAVSSNQKFELLVALHKKARHEAHEHFAMLEQLADSIELRVVKLDSAEDVAARIMKMDRMAA